MYIQITHDTCNLVTLHIKFESRVFWKFLFYMSFLPIVCSIFSTDHHLYNLPCTCIHTSDNYDNTFLLPMFSPTETELSVRCLATIQQRRII